MFAFAFWHFIETRSPSGVSSLLSYIIYRWIYFIIVYHIVAAFGSQVARSLRWLLLLESAIQRYPTARARGNLSEKRLKTYIPRCRSFADARWNSQMLARYNPAQHSTAQVRLAYLGDGSIRVLRACTRTHTYTCTVIHIHANTSTLHRNRFQSWAIGAECKKRWGASRKSRCCITDAVWFFDSAIARLLPFPEIKRRSILAYMRHRIVQSYSVKVHVLFIRASL